MVYRMGFSAVWIVGCVLILGACGSSEPAPPTPAKAVAGTGKPVEPAPAPQPAPKTVNSWNFAKLPVEQWGWTFPGGAKNKISQGAWFEPVKAEPGPRWTGGPLDAGKYTMMRVLIVVTRAKADSKGREPVDLAGAPMLYWATPKDVKAGDAWTTSARNRVRAVRPDKKNPYLWEFPLAKHPRWKGPIGGLTFTIPTPEGEQPLRVVVREITLVE